MDLRDIRRLSFSFILLACALFAWLILLFLHDSGRFEWGGPKGALGWMPFTGWLWLTAFLSAVLLTVVGLTTFGVTQAPTGFAKGSLRQLQCQDCKAVFFVHDAGQRPLTHVCPNCKCLGVFDGEAAPVGTPPKPRPPKELIELGLTCRTCSHRFMVLDAGVRPMKIACPKCKAVGEVF
ncbi:MAG TPA: hypothetical protein VI796_01275 [Candidatus Thermoplasmatota archaeon]|nr:hypothetical protein [Candidatus Thermoplasmatota archaeon]